jgi:hypothetical protein
MQQVENVRNPEVLSWIIENKDKLDVEISLNSGNASKVALGALPEVLNKYKHESCDALASKRKIKASTIPKDIGGRKVTNGIVKLMNQTITGLVDSTSLLSATENPNQLWKQYKKNGYLMFKNLLDRNSVLETKEAANRTLRKLKHVDDENVAISKEGWILEIDSCAQIKGKNKFVDDDSIDETNADTKAWHDFCHSKNVSSLISHEKLKYVLKLLALGKEVEESTPFDPFVFDPNYSWLRVKAPNEFTPEHADVYFFKVFYFILIIFTDKVPIYFTIYHFSLK